METERKKQKINEKRVSFDTRKPEIITVPRPTVGKVRQKDQKQWQLRRQEKNKVGKESRRNEASSTENVVPGSIEKARSSSQRHQPALSPSRLPNSSLPLQHSRSPAADVELLPMRASKSSAVLLLP